MDDMVSHADIISTSVFRGQSLLVELGFVDAVESPKLCVDSLHSVQRFIKEDRLPHLLFYGPPGTGKTSTILACAQRLYGPSYKSMILEVCNLRVPLYTNLCLFMEHFIQVHVCRTFSATICRSY